MPFLPAELYNLIEESVPIVCVDFIPVQRNAAGDIDRIGLILRHSPFGEVWCHLGGRVRFGETVAQALQRHATDTIGEIELGLGEDPQPKYVYQWFPERVAPTNGLPFGRDPRKHAVSLTFLVELDALPVAVEGGEALEFSYWPVDAIPQTWPGCTELFERLGLIEEPQLA